MPVGKGSRPDRSFLPYFLQCTDLAIRKAKACSLPKSPNCLSVTDHDHADSASLTTQNASTMPSWCLWGQSNSHCYICRSIPLDWQQI